MATDANPVSDRLRRFLLSSKRASGKTGVLMYRVVNPVG